MMIPNQREWLGTYDTAEEAAYVWDARARHYRGDDTWTNFPAVIPAVPLGVFHPHADHHVYDSPPHTPPPSPPHTPPPSPLHTPPPSPLPSSPQPYRHPRAAHRPAYIDSSSDRSLTGDSSDRPDGDIGTSTGLDPRRPQVARIVDLVHSHVLGPLDAYLRLSEIILEPHSVRSLLQAYFVSIGVGVGGSMHTETETLEVVFHRMCTLDASGADAAFVSCSGRVVDVSIDIELGFGHIMSSLEILVVDIPLLDLLYRSRDLDVDMATVVNQIITLALD